MTDPDWKALGAALRTRREVLRLPQDLSDRGGPGEMTVRKLERGESAAIRNRTKTQLEHALSWQDGLIDKILGGSATEAELNETVARAGAAQGGGVALGARGRGTATHQTVYPEGIPSGEQFGTATTRHGEPTIGHEVPQTFEESGFFLYKAATQLLGELMTYPSTPARQAAKRAVMDLLAEGVEQHPPAPADEQSGEK